MMFKRHITHPFATDLEAYRTRVNRWNHDGQSEKVRAFCGPEQRALSAEWNLTLGPRSIESSHVARLRAPEPWPDEKMSHDLSWAKPPLLGRMPTHDQHATSKWLFRCCDSPRDLYSGERQEDASLSALQIELRGSSRCAPGAIPGFRIARRGPGDVADVCRRLQSVRGFGVT
jgi:hypothetical protein